MTELHPSGENGCELDEFKGHVFLEKSGMTLTVAKMRAVMKEIDLDFNKYISLTEFLIFHYKVKIADLVDAPQAAAPAAASSLLRSLISSSSRSSNSLSRSLPVLRSLSPPSTPPRPTFACGARGEGTPTSVGRLALLALASPAAVPSIANARPCSPRL